MEQSLESSELVSHDVVYQMDTSPIQRDSVF